MTNDPADDRPVWEPPDIATEEGRNTIIVQATDAVQFGCDTVDIPEGWSVIPKLPRVELTPGGAIGHIRVRVLIPDNKSGGQPANLFDRVSEIQAEMCATIRTRMPGVSCWSFQSRSPRVELRKGGSVAYIRFRVAYNPFTPGPVGYHTLDHGGNHVSDYPYQEWRTTDRGDYDNDPSNVGDWTDSLTDTDPPGPFQGHY